MKVVHFGAYPRNYQWEDGGVREREEREGPCTPEMNQAGHDKSLWIGPPKGKEAGVLITIHYHLKASPGDLAPWCLQLSLCGLSTQVEENVKC